MTVLICAPGFGTWYTINMIQKVIFPVSKHHVSTVALMTYLWIKTIAICSPFLSPDRTPCLVAGYKANWGRMLKYFRNNKRFSEHIVIVIAFASCPSYNMLRVAYMVTPPPPFWSLQQPCEAAYAERHLENLMGKWGFWTWVSPSTMQKSNHHNPVAHRSSSRENRNSPKYGLVSGPAEHLDILIHLLCEGV